MPLSLKPALLMALLCVEGFCLLGAQGSLYALAAHVYPTNIRTTGVVRLRLRPGGAIVSAYVGTYALNYGATAFFASSPAGGNHVRRGGDRGRPSDRATIHSPGPDFR